MPSKAENVKTAKKVKKTNIKKIKKEIKEIKQIVKSNNNTNIILGVLSALSILGIGGLAAKFYSDKKDLEKLYNTKRDLEQSIEDDNTLAANTTLYSVGSGLNLNNNIVQQESKPLTGSQMHAINPNLPIVSYHQLDQYSSLNQLLGKQKAVCILYEEEYNSGHYTLLLQHSNGELEWFDPYGKLSGKNIKLDDEIQYCDYTKEHVHNGMPKLTQLVKASGLPLIVNHYPFQKMNDEISTCGYWVASRYLLRDLTLTQMAKIFLGKKQSADYLVVQFCNEYKKLKST